MPIITGEEDPPVPGAIQALVPAVPGLQVTASAAAAATGIPAPTAVVGWVLVADSTSAGGARVDPVFLAGGAAWTPDQFRAEYGQGITISIRAGR